jgi:multiple sugar transport system permease protein
LFLVGVIGLEKASIRARFLTGLREWMDVIPFIGVGLILFGTFVLYPQIKNIYIALTDYSIMPGAENPFVGLGNFKRAFTDMSVLGSDANYFWLAFRNNVLAVLVTVPGQLIVGLILAVLIHSIKFGKPIYKVIFYIAVICDWVVAANIFDYIFQPDSGSLINYILTNIRVISEPIAWLSETWTANAVIWIFCIWKGFGWTMIIYLAALQGVPSEHYEAATIDGCNALQKFFHITIPSIRGTTFYLLINLIIGAMNIFIQVFLLTKGGPLGTTDVMMNYVYTRAFSYFEFGYAAACGILMGLFVFVVSMALKRFMRYGEN